MASRLFIVSYITYIVLLVTYTANGFCLMPIIL